MANSETLLPLLSSRIFILSGKSTFKKDFNHLFYKESVCILELGEGQRESQAESQVDSTWSKESNTGLNLTTLRSRPKLKS